MPEWYEEDGTLYKFLMDHPSIWYVHLVWTWNRTVDVETPFMAVFKDGSISEVVARYHAYVVDEEYTMIGSREDALAFAKSYDCWDGHFDDPDAGTIKDGILFMDADSYDPDADEFPLREKELTPEYDYSGLVFWGCNGWSYVRSYERNGIIKLVRRDD